MDIVLGAVGGVAGKLAEYIVDPVVRPIARRCPFKNLWEYKSNLENLTTEVNKLEEKRDSVQGLTNNGVEPLPDVNLWLNQATPIISEVRDLISEDNPEQQSMKCCEGFSYSNLKKCYQHRNNVAHQLKDVAQLLQKAMNSTSSWKDKSNIENLRKELEKLVAATATVKLQIKDGEELLPNVEIWQNNANNIINEFSGLINPQQQNMQCCSGRICSDVNICSYRSDNVGRKLKDVVALLEEATKFTKVSFVSEETEYKNQLAHLKKEVVKLMAKRDSVRIFIKDGEVPRPNVNVWLDKVNCIDSVVSSLTSQHSPQRQNNVAQMLNDVAELMQEATDFRGDVGSLPEETLYKINIENLKNEVETLKRKSESVQCLVKVGNELLPDVEAWQNKVREIDNEVKGLASEYNPDQQNNLARMLTEVTQLLQEQAQFREVSYRPIPEQTCLQPSIQQVFFKSRLLILKDIIVALGNTDFNMVGIYGMGGVGKTTLAKEVRNQAIQDKLFDKIVFVEVSLSPDIRTIQGVIADYLGLEFKEETVPGRAGRLCGKLKQEKKILIILDNLWKGIKLEEVGIPFGNNSKGLKLLLTARSHDVLTTEMDSQHNFHVEALSEVDGWSLFKNIAGACIDHPNLKSIAQEVAKKCGGMPIAIVTIAKALKNKSEDEWRDALLRLNNPSPESFEGNTKEVYNSIKLSYDCLPGKLKEIFLLCCHVGRTYDASVQDLLRYGIGLGFFDEFDTVEDALCNVYTSVNQLKATSLLLDAPEAEYEYGVHHCVVPPAYERFAIHDVIYSVSRSIASKDQHVFTVIDGHVPRSLTKEETLKYCTSITLYNIGELPKLELICPNLEFLYVKLKDSYLTIPDNFFIGMSSLRVLHLIRMDLEPLPTSLNSLVNLHALCLDYCKLGDVVVIGVMNKLEILSFRHCDIVELPKEMCQLTNLRLVDLTDCSHLCVIPSKVMSSFTGIQALYMNNTSIQWEVAGPNIEGSNVSIDELKHLHRLTILETNIPDAKMFRDLISSKLKRYKISIGYDDGRSQVWRPHSKISRMLKLRLDTKADWIISQLQGVEELDLTGEVVGAINLLDDLDRNGFRQLQYLEVECNSHCVCLVNSVSCAVLPYLESLMVWEMRSLEKICKNPVGEVSFLNLKTIRVWNCEKLSNIFSFFSSVKVLPNLTDFRIGCCYNMEEIIAIEERDDGNSTEVVHDIQFSQLSYLQLYCLPKLKSFCCKASDTSASELFSTKEVDNPTSLVNEKVQVVMPNLQVLEVCGIYCAEQIWNSILPPLSSCIQNLTKLKVHDCNVKELFSSYMAIAAQSRERQRRDTILFPKLNHLDIQDLFGLTRLCSGYYIEFPLLKEFSIGSCPQLEPFIFDEMVKIPNLEKMSIIGMKRLKMIWHNKLPKDSVFRLKSLMVTSCDSLEQICDLQGINSEESDLDPFVNLQNLAVSDCSSLKYIFTASIVAKEGVVPEEVPVKFVFPNLTSLSLDGLPELKTFYPTKHTVEGPILEELVLFNNYGIHDTDKEGQMQQPLYLYLIQQVFPCLECLTLAGKELMMMEQAHVPECFFHKLRILGVQTDESTIYQLGIIQRFQNLEKLLLTGYSHRTLLGGQTKAAPPAKMKTLLLRSLKDLKYMGEQDSQLDFIFQNFEILKVEQCDSLINLMRPSASFQNLTILHVWYCGSLETIVTSSMAKNLVKLEKMCIDSCPKLTEVIQNQGDATEERIIFSSLETLVLGQMDNLTSFCSCNFTLEFPALEELDVYDCSNMETFSWGDLTMPRLQEVKIDGKSFRLCPDTNLNAIIQQFHEKKCSETTQNSETDQGSEND